MIRKSKRMVRLAAVVGGMAGVLMRACAEQAAPADRFVDSIGVNVHMWFPDTPYVNKSGAVKAKLMAAKIRHIRDMLVVDRGPVTVWRELATNGIKTGFIFTPGWAMLSAFTNYLVTNDLLNAADYFEGPNEYDATAGTDTRWAENLTNYQAALYATLKADSRMSQFPILAPSFLINHVADRKVAGIFGGWCDAGNCHPYPGGQMPSAAQVSDEIAACAINTGAKPVYITETGYHNATNGPHDGNHPVSETAAAIYLPRLYFDAYSRGVVRTYWYEFLDHIHDPAHANAEAHFGLLHYDLTEKPAYVALTNLTAIMQDPGPVFPVGSLNYSLSGAPVRSELFQKRDGGFYLALWREVPVWDVMARAESRVSPAGVAVHLPGRFRVESFNPTMSASVQQTWADVSNVTLNLGGEVLVLKITGEISRNINNL